MQFTLSGNQVYQLLVDYKKTHLRFFLTHPKFFLFLPMQKKGDYPRFHIHFIKNDHGWLVDAHIDKRKHVESINTHPKLYALMRKYQAV